MAERLLRGASGLAILATSREALGSEGETAWQLPPLAHPQLDTVAVRDLADYDAVALFVDRARAAVPAFALDDATAPAVAAICARLDGMPLAIELAAAALPTLGVDALAARLSDALGVLTRGRRTALPRHRTLRAVLDWSYQLLDPAAQALLARLSVFRGAFPLDAAERVGAGPDPREQLPGSVAVFDALGRLVEHSLLDVRDVPDAGESQYALLETVRQYGAERLRGTPDEAPAQRRHAEWIATLAEAAEPLLWSPARGPALARLRHHLDDIRAALTWAAESGHGDALIGARTVAALGWLWVTGLPHDEARRWQELVHDASVRAGLGGASQPLAVRLPFARSMMFLQGMYLYEGASRRRSRGESRCKRCTTRSAATSRRCARVAIHGRS